MVDYESNKDMCQWRARGVLNANLRDIYLEVRMSPLLVVRAPYDVKGEELGHSHFYRNYVSNHLDECNLG